MQLSKNKKTFLEENFGNTSRSYYEDLKYDCVNRESYFNLKDEFGTDLAIPYTEKEIKEYEEKYDIQIPKLLRDYLINISRETIGYYPFIIELVEPDVIYVNDKSNNNKYYSDFYNSGNDKLQEELLKKEYEQIYYIKTHTNGCTDDYYLCVKGKYYGLCCVFLYGRYGKDVFHIE